MADGRSFTVARKERIRNPNASIETTGRHSFYGVDIHGILDDLAAEERRRARAAETAAVVDTIAMTSTTTTDPKLQGKKQLLWTEKYRAKKFTDLVGDERTHREVLRWLKKWDQIVFPSSHRKAKRKLRAGDAVKEDEQEPEHRKILLIHGPPGLGKTTLAHVAARQAGYEPLEINASDDRSAAAVKGKIMDMLTIEGVKSCGLTSGKTQQKNAGKPTALVIDEIDGVTGGAGGSGGAGGGGGDTGFIKALLDLIQADKNSTAEKSAATGGRRRNKKAQDKFRILRPIIAVCNDLYAPALKPLRQYAEVVQMRNPPMALIIDRLEWIFEKEGYVTEDGAVRKIVELSSVSGGTRKGDMRGALVNGEWIATKMKLDKTTATKHKEGRKILTRKAVEDELVGSRIGDNDGKGSSGSGRMAARDALDAVFHIKKELPARGAAAKIPKKSSLQKVQDLVEGIGEFDKLTMDCFSLYPTKNFNDDSLLSKPNTAYDWLFFSDLLSTRLSSDSSGASYLSYPILAFHHLFSTTTGPSNPNNSLPTDAPELLFSGLTADWEAREATKETTSILATIHSSLSSASLSQIFKNPSTIAMELAPYINRILSPCITPVLVSGSGMAIASVRRESEKRIVKRAVDAMEAVGARFEKVRVEQAPGVMAGSGWAYRMEPPIDALGVFGTFEGQKMEVVRYAVRQVLDQEWRKMKVVRENKAREARMGPVREDAATQVQTEVMEIDGNAEKVKRDFFGRVIEVKTEEEGPRKKRKTVEKRDVWVSYNEGFSNAVRKGIRLDELMEGLI
ncbi:P-loop containing nucleoside triphosphate hydrolase protein [Pyronema omphalodes]|nr:P-loop containing nucleoside triphosphate hydrolase protein [Pyronema omphalodes]